MGSKDVRHCMWCLYYLAYYFVLHNNYVLPHNTCVYYKVITLYYNECIGLHDCTSDQLNDSPIEPHCADSTTWFNTLGSVLETSMLLSGHRSLIRVPIIVAIQANNVVLPVICVLQINDCVLPVVHVLTDIYVCTTN